MDILNPLEVLSRYPFMLRALLAVIMVGGVNGVLGSFVVVRGMSFFGDALAHTIMPGVAIAFIITGSVGGTPLFIGGLIAGVLSALIIGWLTRGGRVREDAAIGIVMAGMLALGVAIVSTARSYSGELTHILFGDVLGISSGDLIIMAVCCVLVLIVIGLFYKELLVLSFDTGLAYTLKLPAEALRLLLLTLIAVTIVASLQTVGVSLMLAMLITPAATAQMFVKRLHHMLLIAALLGIFSGVVGLYASYYLGVLYDLHIASGAAIVLTSTLIFTLALAYTRLRGRQHD